MGKYLALLAKTDKTNQAHAEKEEREIDRLAHTDGWDPVPPEGRAYCVLAVCRKYGVTLRIDEDGDLVVGKAGAKADEHTQPWPELLAEIEVNLETVAQLVRVRLASSC